MILRPAEKKDRQQILEMTADTWDGWDYVPLLLDEWFLEKGLFVAEVDQQIVGITKTTVLSPGELWLEGIRTKKELRGKGIGKALAFHQLDDALAQHPRVIRLSTAEVNVESIKLIEKMGFSHVHTFTYLELHDPQPGMHDPTIESIAEITPSKAALLHSAFLKESKGLLPWSWIFREPTTQLLSSYAASRHFFFRQGENGDRVMLLLLPHRYNKKQLEISLIDASSRELIKLLFRFAINHAASLGMEEIAFFAPSGQLEKQAQEAGFFFPYDFSKVHVYELTPPKVPHPSGKHNS